MGVNKIFSCCGLRIVQYKEYTLEIHGFVRNIAKAETLIYSISDLCDLS